MEGCRRASATGSRSGSARPWRLRPGPRGASWAAARLVATGWLTPDRTRTRARPPSASASTGSSSIPVRAILANPRYTGRQVWNRQRRDEVLIDVEDVALGHMTKMRWNGEDDWDLLRGAHPRADRQRRAVRGGPTPRGHRPPPQGGAQAANHPVALRSARPHQLCRVRAPHGRCLQPRPGALPVPLPE